MVDGASVLLVGAELQGVAHDQRQASSNRVSGGTLMGYHVLRLGLAACRNRRDLEWIEPTPREAAACRAVCAGCPVRSDCLETAMSMDELVEGIWGGLDARERIVLALDRGVVPPRILPLHGTNSRYAKHGCRCRRCRAAHAAYESQRRRRPTHRQRSA
jgi:hypothetical protein